MTRFSRVAAARLEAVEEILLASGWTQNEVGWMAPEDFRSALAGHIGHGHLSLSQAIAAQVQFDEALAQKAPKAHGKQYTVGSSHGELTVDAKGFVIRRHLDNNDADGGGHLARINRFDLDEWRKHWGNADASHIDILDLGYWFTDPETGKADYAPPDENWRSDIAKSLLGRRAGAGAA